MTVPQLETWTGVGTVAALLVPLVRAVALRVLLKARPAESLGEAADALARSKVRESTARRTMCRGRSRSVAVTIHLSRC